MEDKDDSSDEKKLKFTSSSKSYEPHRSESLKLQPYDERNEFTSPPLNRNNSQPESTSKIGSIKKSILSGTHSVKSSIKKNTAEFFGVSKNSEDSNHLLWLEKRKRLINRTGGKIKGLDLFFSDDTNDGNQINFFSGEFEASPFQPKNYHQKLPALSLAYSNIRNYQPNKRRNLASHHGDISLHTISSPSHDITMKYYSFDHPSDELTCSNQQESFNSNRMLPEDLIFDLNSTDIPPNRNKTWTVINRDRPRIKSELIESIYDNSNRRIFGMGIVGRLLNRKLKSNLTQEEKKQLYSVDDNRPYFTYWITSVQLFIMILALITYGFGPFGLQKVKNSKLVLVPSLSLQEVIYFEPNNIWLGPRAADLIHLGAKYTPCMRKDKLIFEQINKEREQEKETACCIRSDKSGCMQTNEEQCSKLLSTWKKWTKSDNISLIVNDQKVYRTSGTVCGQDPRYCRDPLSFFPNIWPDDITKWPICRKQKLKTDNLEAHMSCNLIGKPCCVGIHGECRITTKDYCDFVKGFFHEEATLCSQVSCMSDVCGMLQIKKDDNLLQVYRLWTSLFLHAGLIHMLISFSFQYFIMRDFEKLIGSTRICLIYMFSGIGGNLASSIFVPYRAEVGPGGSQFGILAGLIAEVIHSWSMIENPWKSLNKLILIAMSLFLYGVFPWIDNYAHIFGFIIGFLMSLALFPYLTLTKAFNRKLKVILIWSCLITLFIIFVVLFLFLYVFPIYQCKFCSYLNCIPFTPDWCSDHYIEVKRKDIL